MGAEREAIRLLRKFAAECRKLSSECVEGTAPELIAFDFGSAGGLHCAMGEPLARCSPSGDPWDTYYRIRDALLKLGHYDPGTGDSQQILFAENNRARTQAERRARVVFPLLMVADRADKVVRRLVRRRAERRGNA